MTWRPPAAEIATTLTTTWWWGWKGTVRNVVDPVWPEKRKIVRAWTRGACLEKMEFWEKVIVMEWDDYLRTYERNGNV